MERPDLFREFLSIDGVPGDVGPRPLHSDSMPSFFTPSSAPIPSLSSFISSQPINLPSPAPIFLEQMQRMCASTFPSSSSSDPALGPLKPDRFLAFPPSSPSHQSCPPSPSSSPSPFDIKTIQTHAQDSEDLRRNLEYQLQINQLKHLHKLLNFQASMSYMQAVKIAAAADQTQTLVNTLDLAIRHGSHPLQQNPMLKQAFPQSSLVQDHIANVSKQLELISSQHQSTVMSPLPPPFPLPSLPSHPTSILGENREYPSSQAHPISRISLDSDVKRYEVNPSPLLEPAFGHSFEEQHTLQQQRMTKSVGPSPFRSTLPPSRQYLLKSEDSLMFSSPPCSPSSLSSLSHSDPPTPPPPPPTTAEEKYQQQHKRRLVIADNNKQQKGEKGLFFCEDPSCGAELRTRSGFRRHRQKHASGHVLRKRARKSPSSDIEVPPKPLATPATIVTQLQPPSLPSHTSFHNPFGFPPISENLL